MKIELTPAGKLAGALLLLALGAAVAVVQGPDARRYLKMESM